jgi:hypothetical protein
MNTKASFGNISQQAVGYNSTQEEVLADFTYYYSLADGCQN